MQKLTEQSLPNNTDNQPIVFELDHICPSADKNMQMNDEDDDLLSAAAAACSNIKTK